MWQTLSHTSQVKVCFSPGGAFYIHTLDPRVPGVEVYPRFEQTRLIPRFLLPSLARPVPDHGGEAGRLSSLDQLRPQDLWLSASVC